MDKFAKRLIKSNQNARNALVVGTGFGNLEKLTSILQTVFVINDGDRSIKRKNIVYKEDFSNIASLFDIDFLFIDYNQYGNLTKLQSLLQKNKPVIFVEGEKVWDVAEYKFLKANGYSQMELDKGMQKWMPVHLKSR